MSGDMFRVGIVMELMNVSLRGAISKDPRLKERKVQLNIAKQVASGMNFLHSLNPYILHRDLRTPNILLNGELECKIADFGISSNLGYAGMTVSAMYTSLIPPECMQASSKFSKKGDVYVRN